LASAPKALVSFPDDVRIPARFKNAKADALSVVTRFVPFLMMAICSFSFVSLMAVAFNAKKGNYFRIRWIQTLQVSNMNAGN
jgi:hypothetical protein